MRNANPERNHDDNQESIINDFLMKYYFKKAFTAAKLITNKEMQSAGVDVICNSKRARDMKIDIKAQSSAKYINDPRPTFSLEVSTYDRYGVEDLVGWFFSAKAITEYYTFVWIHDAKVDDNKRIRRVDDIQRLEVLTVDAHALQDYIDDILYDHELDDIDAITQSMRWEERLRIDVCDGIYYRHSPSLPEKPVNLVVQKRILQKFAIESKYGHCMVTKEGMRPIYHN